MNEELKKYLQNQMKEKGLTPPPEDQMPEHLETTGHVDGWIRNLELIYQSQNPSNEILEEVKKTAERRHADNAEAEGVPLEPGWPTKEEKPGGEGKEI